MTGQGEPGLIQERSCHGAPIGVSFCLRCACPTHIPQRFTGRPHGSPVSSMITGQEEPILIPCLPRIGAPMGRPSSSRMRCAAHSPRASTFSPQAVPSSIGYGHGSPLFAGASRPGAMKYSLELALPTPPLPSPYLQARCSPPPPLRHLAEQLKLFMAVGAARHLLLREVLRKHGRARFDARPPHSRPHAGERAQHDRARDW